MNTNEINNLDPDDIGLKQVMGNRFRDESKKPMVEPFETIYTNPTTEAKVAQKSISKAMDAQWEPAKPEPNWMDNLKDCAKTSVLFGGLNLLIWYWEVAGLMDESIALPSMLICAALCGLGIGKVCKRGND